MEGLLAPPVRPTRVVPRLRLHVLPRPLPDLRVHRSDATSTVVLEYASEGKVVTTGHPYSNRYISVVTLKHRKVSYWRDYLDPLRVFAALEGTEVE
jgi:ketosteroid isomerase-like protein